MFDSATLHKCSIILSFFFTTTTLVLLYLCCRHKLKLTGRPESLEKAKRAVEELNNTLRAACLLNTIVDEDGIDCVACFCPIDEDDLYRLEACAHPYCKDCVKQQVCSFVPVSVVLDTEPAAVSLLSVSSALRALLRACV